MHFIIVTDVMNDMRLKKTRVNAKVAINVDEITQLKVALYQNYRDCNVVLEITLSNNQSIMVNDEDAAKILNAVGVSLKELSHKD